MQTDTLNTSTENQGFDQMAVEMKTAIEEFDANSSGRLSEVLDMIQPYVAQVNGFVRRYPVQTAVGLVAAGIFVFAMMKPQKSV